jgi:aryl-alcohol dehydrogenase-like predicted oxidoreductase
VIPACKAYGLGLIPWSPLKGGVLGGLKKADEGRRTGDMQQKAVAKHRDKLEKFDALCAELGKQPADVALAWTLHNPVVTAPIVGPRTMEHLEGAMRALEVKLDADVLAKLDAIFPGPGGPAPEAYAW